MCANCKMINETSQKIFDFFQKNDLAPKSPTRTSFERSEKQCVNRRKDYFSA